MKTIQELIDEYVQRAPQVSYKDRAFLERDLWANVRAQLETGRMSAVDWFAENVPGIARRDVRLRVAMLQSKGEIDHLIERVSRKDLSPSTALSLYIKAKRLSESSGKSIFEALGILLAKYDSLPLVARTQDGYLSRRNRMKHSKRVARAQKQQQKNYDRFWEDLRKRADTFFMSSLPNTDPVFVAKMRQELTVMLRVVAKDFKRAMQLALELDTHASTMVSVDAVTREDVEEACATLKMDPPERNHLVDLDRAKRNKWKLANQYHPDKTHQDTGDLFKEVMDSFDVVEKYNSQLMKEGRNGDISG